VRPDQGECGVILNDAARQLLESPALAHLVTLNADGSPQVTIVWVGLEEDEIVAAHMGSWKKVQNVRRDGRVALSIEGTGRNPIGLDHYMVVYGTARITEGGAAALLQRLAHTYLSPDVEFPPGGPHPADAGFITRITAERVTGVGPWVDG
jgi:PPOX class probable F420-dependent enzyme